MADAVDKATKQVIQVPDAELPDAWKSGKVDLVAGKRYQVQLATGEYGTVPAEQADAAIAAGAKFVDPAVAQAAHLQKLYDNPEGEALASDTSLISHFTGGLSDQAMLGVAHVLESTGARKPGYAKAFAEHEQAAQEINPISTAVGAGAGDLALTAILPGGGLAGAGERGALALTEGLGETAAGRIAQRATALGVRGSLEGLQSGVSQSVSDDAFTNHQLTAQHVLGTVGASTLWGGALGLGLGGLGALAGELRGGSRALATTETRSALDDVLASKTATDADVEAVAGRHLGVEPAPGLGQKIGDWSRKAYGTVLRMKGEDPGLVTSFVDGPMAKENLQAVQEATQVRDAASRAIRSNVDDMLTASRDVTEEAQRGLKRGYIRKAVEGVDAAAAAEKARDAADHTISTLEGMLTNGEDFGGKTPISHALKLTNKISDALDTAIEKGDVAEMFGLTDDLKKAIGKYTKGASRLSPGAATDELVAIQNRARAQQLQGLYETLRTGLEDESVWKKAAVDQQSINRAWTTQIEASERFHRALTTEIGRDPANPWGPPMRGVDPAKADAYVRGLTNPAQDLTHKAVRDYVDSTARLTDVMKEAYDLPPAKVAQVAKVKAAASAFTSTLDNAEKTLTLANQFEAWRAPASGPGTALGVVAGLASHGVAGGVTGLALGKVAGVLTHPAETMLQVAGIQRMVRESDGRIARAFRDFAGGNPRAARPLDVKSYPRKVASVGDMMGNPDKLADRIGTNLGDLRTRSPRLADAMTGATLAGLQFLHSKLPPVPPGDPFDAKRAAPLPPPGVRESWLRYYDAVEDPVSVVEDLRDGRINPEGVETLKAVYPQLFQSVRAQAFDRMASGKLADLTKQQRIGLSLALDIPIPELDPAYIRARQAAYAAPGAESPPPGGGPGKRPAKIDLQKSTPMLTVDRLESGTQQ